MKKLFFLVLVFAMLGGIFGTDASAQTINFDGEEFAITNDITGTVFVFPIIETETTDSFKKYTGNRDRGILKDTTGYFEIVQGISKFSEGTVNWTKIGGEITHYNVHVEWDNGMSTNSRDDFFFTGTDPNIIKLTILIPGTDIAIDLSRYVETGVVDLNINQEEGQPLKLESINFDWYEEDDAVVIQKDRKEIGWMNEETLNLSNFFGENSTSTIFNYDRLSKKGTYRFNYANGNSFSEIFCGISPEISKKKITYVSY